MAGRRAREFGWVISVMALLWGAVTDAARPASAGAPTAADKRLDEGVRSYTVGRFDRAVGQLSRLVRDADSLPKGTAARAYLYLGMSHTVLRRPREARRAFERALTHDPTLDLDPSQTKTAIVEAFRRARGQLSGQVEVTAQRADCSVWIDGERAGVVPTSVRLTVGRHEVVVRASGPEGVFSPHREKVVVFPHRKLAVVARLAARAGLLRVDGVPKAASVWVDGKQRGLTPLAIALSPGRHGLEVRKDGFASHRQTIAVKLGETTPLSVELMPQSALAEQAGAQTEPGQRGRVWTWVATGGAAAALAAGIGLGIAAQADYDGYREAAATGDGDRYDALQSSGQGKAAAATAMYVTAGVLAVTAIVLYFWVERPQEVPQEKRLHARHGD